MLVNFFLSWLASIAIISILSTSSRFTLICFVFCCFFLILSLYFISSLLRRFKVSLKQVQIMKVLVLGVVRMSGVSNKTGSPKPYDMTRITYCVPIENITSANRTLEGYGYEVQDLDLDPVCLSVFSEIKLPQHLDLDVQPNPKNLRRNLCHGLRS